MPEPQIDEDVMQAAKHVYLGLNVYDDESVKIVVDADVHRIARAILSERAKSTYPAGVRAGLEIAVKVADSCADSYEELEEEAPLTSEDENAKFEARNIADAIRALIPPADPQSANAVAPVAIEWALKTWVALSGEGAPAGSMERFLLALGEKGVIGTFSFPVDPQSNDLRPGLEVARAKIGSLIKQAQAFGGDGLEHKLDALRAAYGAIDVEIMIEPGRPAATDPRDAEIAELRGLLEDCGKEFETLGEGHTMRRRIAAKLAKGGAEG